MSIINLKDNNIRDTYRKTQREQIRGLGRIKHLNENIGRKIRSSKGKSYSKIKDKIVTHIHENLKEYILVMILFIIGIILGVMFVNNINEEQIGEVEQYINQFVTSIKGEYQIDTVELLKESLLDNLKLVLIMWFIGSTVIGIPIVLGMVVFRGFCLGYTVSASIAILGIQNGIIFFLSSIFLQNLIFIPLLLVLAVSGINLYKSIMRDKRKENIKLEIIRHTIYSILIFFLLIIKSVIEVYISANLLTACVVLLWK